MHYHLKCDVVILDAKLKIHVPFSNLFCKPLVFVKRSQKEKREKNSKDFTWQLSHLFSLFVDPNLT